MTARRLASVADGLTLVCAGATILLALFGAYRDAIGGTVISLRWTHLAFATLSIALLRHLMAPRPGLLAMLRETTRALRARPARSDARAAAGWLTVFGMLQGLAPVLFFRWRELF